MSAPSPATIVFADGADGSPDVVDALRAEGFTVHHAACGRDALDLARRQPGLVILRPTLPDMSVAEAVQQLRADPASAPILVLHLFGPPGGNGTAHPAPGADGYVLEPADPDEVLAHVRSLLRLSDTQKALNISQARLQDVLDHAPVVVQVKDADGHYLLVNRLWEERFAQRREQVVGRSVREVFPDHAEALLANDRRVLESGVPLEVEEEVDSPVGPRVYRSVKFPLTAADGKGWVVCGISTDITERKKAEKALRDTEALYESLVEGLPVCILRKDRDGRFTFANRAFCAELGRPLAEIYGRTDFDLYPEPLARKYQGDDRWVMETGEVLADVESHLTTEGTMSHVEVVKSPLRDSAGQVIGVQAVFWDVTARKRAEEELNRTAAEFRVARRIQQRLFPTSAPEVPGIDIGGASYGFDIGGASYPAEAIGGDYFDYLRLLDGSLGVAIGDVSGHGVGPALLMAEVRAYLRGFVQTQADVRTILGLVNRVIVSDIEGDRFITLLLARLDPHSRTLTYASAGHASGYIFNDRGEMTRELRSTSIPLGILADGDFPSSEPIPLGPGDMVLFLTDGIVEARSPEGMAFGAGRTADLVRVYRRAPARQIVENLYHAVRAFAQYRPQIDDITATVIKVAPG